MKLIEAEKAKDVIHEYFKSLMVKDASGTDVYKLAVGIVSCLEHDANLLKAIDELPSVQPETNCSEIPNNWIPCSERLPDKRGDYLVTLRGNGEPWVEIALWNETFGGRWQMVLYNDVDYSDISNVIAWMPLPEPYQGRGEEHETD